MSDIDNEKLDQLRRTTDELVDAVNRLTATMARVHLSQRWLAAVMEWAATPWWRRGKAPKCPKE